MKRNILLIFVAMMFADHPLAANDWNAVQMLSSGQKIRVESHSGKKFKGEFVSSNDTHIILRSKRAETAILRSDVRKIGAVKVGRERYGILGALAIAGGGAASLATSLGQVKDIRSGNFPRERGAGFHILTSIAPVAGGGVLAIMGGYKTVYEAPP